MNEKMDVWLAGFWEGEGCISPQYKSKTRFIIDIAQSITENRDVEAMMEKLKNTYGGNVYKNIIPNYKTQLRWRLFKREEVINFIKKIIPYCQFRKNELINVLEVMEKAKDLKTIYFDEEKAIRMRKNGLPWSSIAISLGIDCRTIKKKIYSITKQYKAIYKNRNIIDVDRANDLRQKGLTYKKIGEILGVHTSVIHKYLNNKYN